MYKITLPLLSLILLCSCATHPIHLSPLNQRVVDLAISEWNYFGRQTVILNTTEESIHPVGYWEDDEARADRIRQYWRVVGRPEISGYNCEEPWSAAFISWLMSTAGVPDSQFQRADAHWVYLDAMLSTATHPDSLFIPHKLKDYSPQKGDLICAYRESEEKITQLEGLARIPPDTRLHCDLVVRTTDDHIEAIGGNVRNSVSKTIMPLDTGGILKPLPRRHWFMAVEMRQDGNGPK